MRIGTLAVSLVALAAPLTAHAEDACAGLLAKTRAFSDAGQTGDGAAMAALLDDRVVFFNEGGDRSTKADMADSTPSPPPAGVRTVMTVTDWACELHGDVAVASFIDDQQQDFHGQAFHARYRSVETWLKTAGAWRMIASQTLALQDDPPAVTLSARELEDYVGAYEAAPDVRFTFSLKGNALLATTGGTPLTEQKAELRDVFFTPGRARTIKVFERDSAGRVTGFVLRREGHDIHFKRVMAA